MDIESLKVVLSTVQLVSGDEKEVAVWWFALQVLQTFLWFCFGVVVAVAAYHLILRHISEDLAHLRDAMGVGSPGTVTHSEIADMFRWIKERR